MSSGTSMHKHITIGIVVPSNNRYGPQKIAAMAAVDLARSGHTVSIFVPVLPYFYYYVTLKRQPLVWARLVRPYLTGWFRYWRFSFQDVLDDPTLPRPVHVRFVPRLIPHRALRRLETLILMTIADVAEYRNRFPQTRQLYLIHHPEERAHGHGDLFKALRHSFQGHIVAVSPFTAAEIADHVPHAAVVPDPISPTLWAQRSTVDPTAPRKDVLVCWKDDRSGRLATELIHALRAARSHTTFTIWCRRACLRAAHRAFADLQIIEEVNEHQLCDLYRGHHLLLFPSLYEGFGMPPIEALACGCIPVLKMGVGATELYARDGENVIALNGDVDQTAHRMAAVLDDPKALASMRVAAVVSLAPFSPEGYGQRLLEATHV